ncbi:MAG: FAD-dependent monooxygenase, partial [Burkholderiales bacterium]|nr:FAD-dependent monooxygenase [Burkholderiales bacterium]
VSFREQADRVTAVVEQRDGGGGEVLSADLLIGADGIHSAVRATFYPDEGPPAWNGLMLWRGAVQAKPFLTGRSMIIAGGMNAKFVCYPISQDPARPETVLTNWAVVAKTGDGGKPPRRLDWNRVGKLDELMAQVQGASSRCATATPCRTGPRAG